MLCIQKASGDSQVVQWLGFQASTAEVTGFIPGWGTKIPHTTWHSQKKQVFLEDSEWNRYVFVNFSP